MELWNIESSSCRRSSGGLKRAYTCTERLINHGNEGRLWQLLLNLITSHSVWRDLCLMPGSLGPAQLCSHYRTCTIWATAALSVCSQSAGKLVSTGSFPEDAALCWWACTSRLPFSGEVLTFLTVAAKVFLHENSEVPYFVLRVGLLFVLVALPDCRAAKNLLISGSINKGKQTQQQLGVWFASDALP